MELLAGYERLTYHRKHAGQCDGYNSETVQKGQPKSEVSKSDTHKPNH